MVKTMDLQTFLSEYLVLLLAYCGFHLTYFQLFRFFAPSIAKDRKRLAWIVTFTTAFIVSVVAPFYTWGGMRTIYSSSVSLETQHTGVWSNNNNNHAQDHRLFPADFNNNAAVLGQDNHEMMGFQPTIVAMDPSLLEMRRPVSQEDGEYHDGIQEEEETVRGAEKAGDRVEESTPLTKEQDQGKRQFRLFFDLRFTPDDNSGTIKLVVFFMAYLIMDITLGLLYYREQVTLLAGWLHHIVYIGITYYAVTQGETFTYASFMPMEVPTIVVGVGCLDKSLRRDMLYGVSFILFRIMFDFSLTHEIIWNREREMSTTFKTILIFKSLMNLKFLQGWFSQQKRLARRRRIEATAKASEASGTTDVDPKIVSIIAPAIDAGSGSRTSRPVYKSNIPAPAPQTILEEDEYIEALSKIIERDFFPDLARLKRQHAYLDAVEQNDTERIKAAARELAGNDTPLAKRRLKTPARTPRFDRAGLPNESWTPARLDGVQATPSWGDNEPPTPAFLGTTDTPIAETPSQYGSKSRDGKDTTQEDAVDTSLSLDQFQARYTSEDNASFNEIIEKINTQKREKYKWLYDQEKKNMRLLENGNSTNPDQKLLGESGENGAGSQALVRVGDSSSTLDGPSKLALALNDNRSGVISTWEYKAKNALMYGPEGLGTNIDEKSIRGNPKEIVHRNTGFQGQDLLMINQTAAAKFDPAPYMKTDVTDSPKVAGFSFVSSTPSPSMSQMGDDPEMLTWGTIEDEPLLISSGIQASTPSPFKLPPTPRRELIAQKLAEKASKSFREGSSLRAKVFASPSSSALAQYRESMGGKTPTPRFNSPYGVASPSLYNKTPGGPGSNPTRLGSPNPKARAEMLSPAAKSLLDRARNSRSRGADQQLRSSYGNTTPGNGSDGICVLCKKSCEVIQLVENVEDLPEHIQPFFRPFERLCNEAVSTWKFQEQNLTKLIDHLQSKTKRQYEVLVKARTELSNMKAMKV
ncbi:DiGeorge syndrome critical region protein 14 [Linnemannia exigua]|uniref:DiGeorge syndrome critical region protein 14 n=1 Tax=Linnemannia exigua TaxID=604196 RepID=A0AAD4D9M1_9FUNG|nr:DiGeorge syndrome critical region protein 14 [Linnemannia exigua]